MNIMSNIKIPIIHNAVAFLLVILLFVGGHAENYEVEDYICWEYYDRVDAVCGCCWHVSIQYTASVFYSEAWQGMVADFACKHIYTVGLPITQHPTCSPDCGVDCACYNNWYIKTTYVAAYMDLMGFSIETKSGPTSIEDLCNDFCGMDTYCYLIEDTTGDPGHIFVVSGMKEEAGIVQLYINDNLTLNRWKPYNEVLDIWNSSIRVCGWAPSEEWRHYVSIDDIEAFSVSQYSNVAVELQFQIDESANPSDIAAVYITDNIFGPARLIEALRAVPALEPAVNTWYDTLLQYDDYYYYYLLHDCSSPSPYPIDKLREPDTGGPLHFIASEVRPSFSSPTNLVVCDYPMDAGDAVKLNWQLSQDDALIDCYNIYRASSELYTMQYLVSIDKGVSEYTDNDIIHGMQYWYMVSAAHHGGIADVPSGFYAIWNEFTDTFGPMKPVDNLVNVISLPSSHYDSLLMCPAGGDADTLRVCIQVIGEDSVFVPDIPNESITLVPFDCPDIYFCDGGPFTAIHDTDVYGNTEFSVTSIGGCDSLYVYANVMGHQSSNYMVIYIKSPDINGDGRVSLIDYQFFLLSYNKQYPDPDFCECCDFNWDNQCTLFDFGLFAEHYPHKCEDAVLIKKIITDNDVSTVKLEMIVDNENNEGMIKVKLFLCNAYDISSIALAINNNIPGREYVRWIPNPNIDKTTLACPVINDGRSILFIASAGGQNLNDSKIELGTIEYIDVGCDIQLAGPRDFEKDFFLVFGEYLNSNNYLCYIQESEIKETSEMPPVSDYLDNSYPNPFNPATTIKYGIAKGGPVSLSIYNVNGQLIKTLVNKHQQSAHYTVLWDGTNNHGISVGSGVYFYRLKTKFSVKTKKMILLR